jgi:CheY-like chemotaxis protein
VRARFYQTEDLSRRVLIVDDDADLRCMLRSLLAAEGFAVYTASHGQSALRLLDLLRPAPRCVILDLQMPVMNGWEFMERLQERLLKPAVVVLSSADRPPPGARHYFPKPPRFDALLEAVRDCCGVKR